MAYRDDIRLTDQWFTNTDRVFTFIIYVASATDAEIVAGTAARENITGQAFSWIVKRKRWDEDVDAVITKTTSSGLTLTSPGQGELQASVADTDTATLAGDTYWHELKRTDPGAEDVQVYGTASLQKSLHLTG